MAAPRYTGGSWWKTSPKLSEHQEMAREPRKPGPQERSIPYTVVDYDTPVLLLVDWDAHNEFERQRAANYGYEVMHPTDPIRGVLYRPF